MSGAVKLWGRETMANPAYSYVLFAKGDRLDCTVTPTDGDLQAASKSVRSKVRLANAQRATRPGANPPEHHGQKEGGNRRRRRIASENRTRPQPC